MATADVPPYHELLWPTLQAVTELRESASIDEITETVIKRRSFSERQQAVLHNNGSATEIGYRLAWARSYLKGMGLLTNSTRGIWAPTDEGTALVTDPAATDSRRRDRVRELSSGSPSVCYARLTSTASMSREGAAMAASTDSASTGSA